MSSPSNRRADPVKTKTGKDRLAVLSIKQLHEKIAANSRPKIADKMRRELARRKKMGLNIDISTTDI